MKQRTARRTAAIVGTLAAATTMVATAPAQATTLAPSHVTAHPTTTTPAAGETFRVSGAVWSEGVRVPATIRVKTFQHDHWVQLTGAVMHTNRDNRYTIRIILRLKGRQLLRVVGDPDAARISIARKNFAVVVH